MKVAAIQMVSSTRLADNLDRAGELIAEAARGGAELAVLPEYFCLLGQRDTDKLAIQEPFGCGPIQRFLSGMARDHGVWLVGGTLPLTVQGSEIPLQADRVFNSALVFAPDGRCVARYDKMHLFRFDNGAERYDEARVLQAGALPQLFELPSVDGHVWRVGLSVCYDLRFPELYRHYTAQGADLLLVPSAFTHGTGQAHWELLLRARAVENLACVAAAAQGGLHENGRRTWGHTMVVDPWGAILARREADGEGVVLADLDARQLARCRAQLPALEHRRL
jgi:predicted amidohydrolase